MKMLVYVDDQALLHMMHIVQSTRSQLQAFSRMEIISAIYELHQLELIRDIA